MASIVSAEDDSDIAEMWALFLSRAGHTVRSAADGGQALDHIAACRPDLVVLDHHMPVLTGLEVARQLRREAATATLTVLMISATPPDDARQLCDQVISKPTQRAVLLAAVTDLLLAGPRDRARVG